MNSTKYHSLFLLYKLLIHINNIRICVHCNVPVNHVVQVNVPGLPSFRPTHPCLSIRTLLKRTLNRNFSVPNVTWVSGLPRGKEVMGIGAGLEGQNVKSITPSCSPGAGGKCKTKFVSKDPSLWKWT